MKRRLLIVALIFNTLALLGGGGWVMMTYLLRRTYARPFHDHFGQGLVYDESVAALQRLANDMLLGSMLVLGFTLVTIVLTVMILMQPAADR